MMVFRGRFCGILAVLLALSFAALPSVAQAKEKSTSSSSGLSKPSLPTAKPPAASGSSGLVKPSLPGSAPSAAAANSPGLLKPSLPGSAPATAKPPATGNAASATGGGLNKPALPGAASSPPPVANTAPPAAKSAAASGLDAAASKSLSKSALSKFDAERTKFAAPPAAPVDGAAVARNPVWNSYGQRYHTADDYYAARERASLNLHWQPPLVVYRSAPSYGMWDTLFLYLILDRVTENRRDSAMWAYSHADDPGYQAWHRELAQSSDPAMQAKLATLDARVAALEAEKTIKDTTSLPEGVDPALALAPQAVLSAQAAAHPSHGPGFVGWVIILLLGGTIAWLAYKKFVLRR